MTSKNRNTNIIYHWSIVLIFFAALAIRLYDFDDPPLDFHPARQLHSALIARAEFLNHEGDLPGFNAEYEHEAIMRGVQEPWIEPPIFEYLTARLYLLAGDADLRIPRACSILFWLIGGWGILRLSSRFTNRIGSFVCLAFFLLFPYGIFASRSFQPDPLMIMFLIWALEALLTWNDRQTFQHALLAGFAAGVAILVKQVSIFPFGMAAVFFVLSEFGLKKALRNKQIWLIALMSLLPMLIYNFWGYFIQGFLVQQYQGRFLIEEIISPAFYIRWIRKLDQVFGIPLVIGSLLGIVTIAEKKNRMLWIGFLAGYGLYGLALPHHIGTHDYYQLPFFPVLAVGTGKIADSIANGFQLFKAGQKSSKILFFLLLFGFFGWWIADSAITLKRADYRNWPRLWQELAVELDPYEGQINTIGIMDDYGAGMIYWGLRTPLIWEENVEKLNEYDAMEKIRKAMMNREFLIVTDFKSYYQQPRLQRWLMSNATVYRQTADYLVFDLRGVQ
jgi:4-amino-4-deoxy-L-arabinose transferase-like glycosyltransferase